MPTILEHILLPLDFTAATDRLVDVASTLAAAGGATIHLMHVMEEPFMTDGPYNFRLADTTDRRDARYSVARARLRVLATALSDQGIHATVEARAGAPAEEIVKAAVDYGADLIVMGTHARSGLQHFLIGSVAEEVIRRARCPVLTVRNQAAGREQESRRDVA